MYLIILGNNQKSSITLLNMEREKRKEMTQEEASRYPDG